MFLHNLHMLVRACWRKYPGQVLAVVGILLALLSMALNVYMMLRGSR
jgi:hypothetical protein